MKTLIIILTASILISTNLFSQDMAMNNHSNYASIMMGNNEVPSKINAVIMQRMTTLERTKHWNKLYKNPPTNGFIIYDTDENDHFFFNGKSWERVINATSDNNEKTSYGQLSNINNGLGAVIPNVSKNYVGWTDANVAAIIDMKHDVSNPIADRIIVNDDSKYKISISATFNTSFNEKVKGTLHVNGRAFEEISFDQEANSINNSNSVSGIIELNKDDFIDIRFKTNSKSGIDLQFKSICVKIISVK